MEIFVMDFNKVLHTASIYEIYSESLYKKNLDEFMNWASICGQGAIRVQLVFST